VNRLTRIAHADAHEGPVHVAEEDALYFTSVPAPAVAIRRLDLRTGGVTTLVGDADGANGMTLAADGRLLVCVQGSLSTRARLAYVDRETGEWQTLVDQVDGLPLNSPNDVVVGPDGAVWFTDPSYGWLQGFRPRPRRADAVYRVEPWSGRIDVVAEDFDKPNGIALSADGRRLYVTDSGANQEPGSFYADRPHHIRAFDVGDGGVVRGGAVLAVTDPGFPDGIKLDPAGRVHASAFSGVQVFDPGSGALVDQIALPGAVNFAFGDDRLFITTDTAVWAAVVSSKGASPWPISAHAG